MAEQRPEPPSEPQPAPEAQHDRARRLRERISKEHAPETPAEFAEREAAKSAEQAKQANDPKK